MERDRNEESIHEILAFGRCGGVAVRACLGPDVCSCLAFAYHQVMLKASHKVMSTFVSFRVLSYFLQTPYILTQRVNLADPFVCSLLFRASSVSNPVVLAKASLQVNVRSWEESLQCNDDLHVWFFGIFGSFPVFRNVFDTLDKVLARPLYVHLVCRRTGSTTG